MNEKLLELAARRGALAARIVQQRETLAREADALSGVFSAGDALLRGIDWLKQHPLAVGTAVAGAVALRPRRALRWARRGFFMWRGWKAVRNSLARL